jgi:hypothetical protein
MWWIVRKRKDLRRRRWGGGGKAFWETFDLDQGKVAEHDLFGSDSYTTKEQEKQRNSRDRNQEVRHDMQSRPRLGNERVEERKTSAEGPAALSDDPLIALKPR